MDYGIKTHGLPVIVIYPEHDDKSDIINCTPKTVKQSIKNLWDNLPVFRDSMDSVPTLHVPNKKDLIKKALEDPDFMVNTKGKSGVFFYPC